ncbi:putative blue pigment (indigoidine) exporter [Paenibacillus sp. V4I3]|uniref:DMT family transporter n=1 Tax=unclassified Paenibacillus TaxID=185978 RepID=UPI00278B1D23|nr:MULTISPECIES: DMT family transporter [unclassified Paenibacillus]MDQ0871919.1 putative blue pigment (indigoidine) exporter [Paenibacillus sp. V4I3]MDQ0892184.1 putative blue pigment (indigoidine) exporter [Paenibacillus sp. V4I9]
MNRYLFGLMVVVTTSLMGSSFAVGKMGLAYFSPLLLVGCRFTLAGLVMALFVRKRPRPGDLLDWSKIMSVGLFQTAGVMGCIFLSLRTITAGESSILTFTNPLLVIVLGTLFLGAKYRISQWIGVMIGCAGVFITLGVHMQLQTGTLLGMGSAISWAISTLLVKKWGASFDVWVLTAYQMLFGGLLLLVMSLTIETPKLILGVSAVLILLWLAIMASIVQFASWFFLLKQGDPGKTSAFLFLAPFFGVVSGWLLLGEVIEWFVYVGGTLILIGIFFVNWTFSTQTRRKAKVTSS